jgi:uncharacterized membrane protein YsdA (DUF1294 family)
MVFWGLVDSVRGKYSVWWMYLVLLIFLLFTFDVRNDMKKDYIREKKLFRQGLME